MWVGAHARACACACACVCAFVRVCMRVRACACACACVCEIQIYHDFHKQNNGVFIKERKRINFPVIRVVILYRRDGSLHSCVCVCVCVCVVLTNTVVVEIFRFSNTMVFTKNCRCPNLHFLAPFSFSHFLQIKPSLSL